MNKLFTIFALAALIASALADPCTPAQTTSGCATCNAGGSCNFGPTAYSNSPGTCELCSTPLPGCTACSSDISCTTCGGSYYKKTDNTCAACSTVTANCATCTLSGTTPTCSTCSSELTVSSNTCVTAVQTFSSKFAFTFLAFVAALVF